MKIIFKILVAPFVLILTVIVAFMQFLFHISGWVFRLVSSVIGIIGVITLFTGPVFNGVALLVIAFLVSPYGIPMLAVHLWWYCRASITRSGILSQAETSGHFVPEVAGLRQGPNKRFMCMYIHMNCLPLPGKPRNNYLLLYRRYGILIFDRCNLYGTDSCFKIARIIKRRLFASDIIAIGREGKRCLIMALKTLYQLLTISKLI